MIFLLWANGIAMTMRIVQRWYFVTRLYGWEHGLLSIPRMIIGNFVNFMAVSRAWKMFLTHLVTGKRLVWDKTMHDFPSSDGLSDRKQRLGELLLSWQAIDEEKLERALGEKHAAEMPIGRVLVAHGWLDEETLAEAIAFQADLPRERLDAARLVANASQLPLELVVRNRVLPYGDDGHGHAVLLTASPLPDDALATLQAHLALPLVQRIVREGEVADGLRLLRGGPLAQPQETGAPATGTQAAAQTGAQAGKASGVPLLGDLLIERGAVSRKDFEEALQRYRPADHGRIGDYMVKLGVITADALNDAIAEQQRRMHEMTAAQ